MTRHLVTIDDLSEDEIQAIFSLADEFLDDMGTPHKRHRVRGRKTLADQFILATLFYEASTRTRFSFESAMYRLGGQVLSSADPNTTSAAKGETIADTVRVLENYADVLIIRHPKEGAVRVAAEYTDVPVINAGDGGHEHPTQTLCDLYTLRREKGTLKDLNVLLWGDLKNGRTVHSLVYGLARFGARIIPVPADGFGLPDHVIRRLLRDYDCAPISGDEAAHTGKLQFDVAYVTPSTPHQLTMFSDVGESGAKEVAARLPKNALAKIDACYVTRLQKERMQGDEVAGDYPVVDKRFMQERLGKDTRVLHPLPRVSELGYDLDSDERAVYFKQASYGVPVRMALIAALLEIKPGMLLGESPRKKHPIYTKATIACQNKRCISQDLSEQRYLKQKFWIIAEETQPLLRCMYCEHEFAPEVVARHSTKKYPLHLAEGEPHPDDLVFFADAAAAEAAGYHPYKQKVHV